MALDRNFIAIIGRIHPAIYDVVFPHGPVIDLAQAGFGRRAGFAHRADVHAAAGHGGATFGAAELNPQPLPPREIFTGIQTGAAVGHELVHAAGFAKAFGLEFAFDVEDICPPPRPFPPLPWPFPWPPSPYPWRQGEVDPEFTVGYGLGLGAVLEATADVWQQLPNAGFMEKLYSVAGDAALGDRTR